MKLVLFSQRGADPMAGILTDAGVVPLSRHTASPQAEMEWLIEHFETVRPDLDRARSETQPIPLSEVQLLPPVPRPGKLVCSTATYAAQRSADRAQLLFTLKSAESVIGPGQQVRVPEVGDAWRFQPEAELGLVIRGPAKNVAAADWRRAVFGYTCVIDVMASGDTQFGRDFWLAKADTLGPLGPCIVTIDEIADPASLRVASAINGQPAQDYAIADADWAIDEQIELLTTIMTLYSGDVVACGTSPHGLRPLATGDEVQVTISDVGQLAVEVRA